MATMTSIATEIDKTAFLRICKDTDIWEYDNEWVQYWQCRQRKTIQRQSLECQAQIWHGICILFDKMMMMGTRRLLPLTEQLRELYSKISTVNARILRCYGLTPTANWPYWQCHEYAKNWKLGFAHLGASQQGWPWSLQYPGHFGTWINSQMTQNCNWYQ